MVKVIKELFNIIDEDEIYDIIKWKIVLESKTLSTWYNAKKKNIMKLSSIDVQRKRLAELNYEYYRKKLALYIDVSINIRSKYLRPIKNEKVDVEHLNKMWNSVQDEELKEIAKEDTNHMVTMMNKEIKTNVKAIKREKCKVNIFTFILSIISGIGGSIITILVSNR